MPGPSTRFHTFLSYAKGLRLNSSSPCDSLVTYPHEISTVANDDLAPLVRVMMGGVPLPPSPHVTALPN